MEENLQGLAATQRLEFCANFVIYGGAASAHHPLRPDVPVAGLGVPGTIMEEERSSNHIFKEQQVRLEFGAIL